MALPTSPEKGTSVPPSSVEAPKSALKVVQPKQIGQVLEALETIDALAMRVGETTGEDSSRDMGGGSMTGSGGRSSGTSARDEAIAKIPAAPAVRQELEKHIRNEIRGLEAQAKRTARLSKAGGAYQLNEIYAKIRRLNALLVQLFEASYDVLKRLFVRVFIDKQPIL